jgi:TctA family transporter
MPQRANSRPQRYGQTDAASVAEFVQGYQAYQDGLRRDALKIAATGLLTAAAVSAYRLRRR